MPFDVDDRVSLDAFCLLARIIADRSIEPPFLVGSATCVSMMAAVGSAHGGRLASSFEQCLMTAIERAVSASFPEIVVDRGVRGKCFGSCRYRQSVRLT